jgi:hypothetical protein
LVFKPMSNKNQLLKKVIISWSKRNQLIGYTFKKIFQELF